VDVWSTCRELGNSIFTACNELDNFEILYMFSWYNP
jgi:hypothetical protein